MSTRILIVFGTRPEAIKMVPVIKQLIAYKKIQVKVCVTAQHREMLDQVLEMFSIVPNYDLDIMKKSQSLSEITSSILIQLDKIINEFNPNLLIVHGDTATTLSASISAFYNKVKIAHIEAGLRTGNINSPWREEANRKLTSIITNFHFAPTEQSKKNLIDEG